MTMDKENMRRKRQPRASVPSVSAEPQDEKKDDKPDEESLAATDEFFSQQPALPEPKVAKDSETTPSPPADDQGERPLEPTVSSSPLEDYVREIQEEFEEQEEEGKL
jgi:hypothetical protein